jgi:hypothetical protein
MQMTKGKHFFRNPTHRNVFLCNALHIALGP